MAQNHKVVSHTIRLTFLVRLERLAYRARVSRSAIIEHAVGTLFTMHPKDATLIESLASGGATRRRPSR